MNHEESKLQQQCVAWFRAQYPQYAMLLTHPINEGSGHSATDRRRQGIHKAEGAVAGVPDLILFMPSSYEQDLGCYIWCHGLGLELKTEKGRQSQEQKDFQKMFESAGYRYLVIRSLGEFQKAVNAHISGIVISLRKRIAGTHVEITKATEQRERDRFYKIIGKK